MSPLTRNLVGSIAKAVESSGTSGVSLTELKALMHSEMGGTLSDLVELNHAVVCALKSGNIHLYGSRLYWGEVGRELVWKGVEQQ